MHPHELVQFEPETIEHMNQVVNITMPTFCEKLSKEELAQEIFKALTVLVTDNKKLLSSVDSSLVATFKIAFSYYKKERDLAREYIVIDPEAVEYMHDVLITIDPTLSMSKKKEEIDQIAIVGLKRLITNYNDRWISDEHLAVITYALNHYMKEPPQNEAL